jgi:hypothetical protein
VRDFFEKLRAPADELEYNLWRQHGVRRDATLHGRFCPYGMITNGDGSGRKSDIEMKEEDEDGEARWEAECRDVLSQPATVNSEMYEVGIGGDNA